MDIRTPFGYNDKSKSCDRSRSKIRDRSSPARSYGVVGFSALLGGPGLAGGPPALPVVRTTAALRRGILCRMPLPPDSFGLREL